MNISSIVTARSYPKSIIASLKSTHGLPFREILSPEVIAESINVPYRERYEFYSPEITLWAFLSQALDADQSLDAAVKRVIAFHLAIGHDYDISPNTAAFSKARSRLPEEIISNLARDSAERMEENIPVSWLWNKLHLKLVDGTTVSMPDTPGNQKLYPQPGSQKKGIGFPIARIVAVISCVTGAVLDLAIGPYAGKETGEHALLRQIINVFEPGDVALGDSYYASFFLIAMLIKKGVKVIFPMHTARNSDFRRGKQLDKKDHIAKWIKPKKPKWMDQETYDGFPAEIDVREVMICNNKKGFRSEQRIIVTTFLDAAFISSSQLATLYSCRWWVELDLRSLKQTMHMDILRGKSPEMVRKEI